MDTYISNALDRCDRCGAQSLSVAKKTGHEDLMFCMHHIRKHEDALITSGWTVVTDESTYESYRGALDVSPV